MPALESHRIFLSSVTNEFGRYRTAMAPRFEAVSVKAVFQEEFEYADSDVLEKLYQHLLPCDVIVHFVGEGAGAPANSAAVKDFLQRSESRGEDFLGFWKREHDLNPAFFDSLSYTQWEAALAWFLKKQFFVVQPSAPAQDGHPTNKTPFVPTNADMVSQKRHLEWLSTTIRRYPQKLILNSNDSYLEDAFNKTVGFLLHEAKVMRAGWDIAANELRKVTRYGVGAVDDLCGIVEAASPRTPDLSNLVAQMYSQLIERVDVPFAEQSDHQPYRLIDELVHHENARLLILLIKWLAELLGKRGQSESAYALREWTQRAMSSAGIPEGQLFGRKAGLARFVRAGEIPKATLRCAVHRRDPDRNSIFEHRLDWSAFQGSLPFQVRASDDSHEWATQLMRDTKVHCPHLPIERVDVTIPEGDVEKPWSQKFARHPKRSPQPFPVLLRPEWVEDEDPDAAPDPLSADCFACACHDSDELCTMVETRGAFFATGKPNGACQHLVDALTRAALGIWIREADVRNDDVENLRQSLDGVPLAALAEKVSALGPRDISVFLDPNYRFTDSPALGPSPNLQDHRNQLIQLNA